MDEKDVSYYCGKCGRPVGYDEGVNDGKCRECSLED